MLLGNFTHPSLNVVLLGCRSHQLNRSSLTYLISLVCPVPNACVMDPSCTAMYTCLLSRYAMILI